LQKYKRPGALKQNGQPSAVDLRSNGHGRMRAPWTTPCARRTGPRWTEGKGVPPCFDQDRPCQIRRPGTCVSGARRRARRSAAARGRGSPALALDSAPGHLLDRGLEQNAVRVLAHVTKGSGGRSGLTGGRHRKGAARPLRRARGGAAVREMKGNWEGVFAHRV
jgi:hypothetical protein